MSFLRGLVSAGVRNPVFANLLMVVLLAGGIYSARTLVTETYPEFSYDRVSVEVAYPGASPEEVEQSVCMRIEEVLEGMEGIRKYWSRASQDGGLVMVELLDSVTDIRQAMQDIKDRVDRITTFPPDVERPMVLERMARAQIINVVVYGDAQHRTLKEIATEIKEELLGREAISQVEVTGARDYEISIEVAPEALLQYGLSLQEVTQAVARNSLNVPAGTLRTGQEEFTLRTTGRRYTAQEFEDLVIIARPDGTLVQLGQVAKVTDGFAEDFKSGRFQGQPAILIEIFKTRDQDTSTIARTVREYVADKRLQMPEGIHLDTWSDTSREVEARMGMLAENGVMGMVLVVIVLSLFLDFRVSLYVALGLPISFAGALIVMHWTGQTLNMITLFGLIMVTGIIVDDAIVISDGFRSRIAAGDKPDLAAINGTLSVALPVAASSLTTILAFAPLLVVVGIMGKFIAVLPVVVIAAIIFSGVEAFLILPSHLQHCMHEEGRAPGWLASRWLGLRQGIDRRLSNFIERYYAPCCRRACINRGLTLSIALACVLLSVGLVAGGRVAFTLLPEVDGDTLRAQVRFWQGVPVEQTIAAGNRLEAAADALNDRSVLDHAGDGDLILRTFTVVGEWSGWIGSAGSHLCEATIELMPAERRRLPADTILQAWREQTGEIPDAAAVTFERAERGPADKPLEIRFLGNDLHQLEAVVEEASERLRQFAGVSGIEHDLQPGKREIRVQLKPLARTLGVTLEDLATQLRSGYFGGEAVRVQRGREEVRVQVRYPDDQRRSIADLEALRVTGASGQEIPILELADFRLDRGYATIDRQNGQRRARVMANIDERRANAEQVLAEFQRDYLASVPARHPGVDYRVEGQHAQMVESLGSLFSGFALALVAIYAVLGSMLRSYFQPLVIMIAVPMGFAGAVAGHLLLGYDLTIMSIFGVVAMAGVVVNDSLVLLDQINQSLAEGKPVMDATLNAGKLRFRAVLLTTVTTVAGLAPLLLERSSQAQTLIPMAISLTFGLAFATLLTLVVVPALNLGANDVRRAFVWLRRGGEYPSAESVEPLHRRAAMT